MLSSTRRQGGRVSVTIRSEGPDAVIRVRDTGVGIASELLPRIFDVFVQARQKPDRAMGGLGLGLALVKRLVEMQRGTVGVASDGPGRGAEFMRPTAALGARRGRLSGGAARVEAGARADSVC